MKPFPAPSIRHAEVEGLRIILDLTSESYRVLDDQASLLWSVLIGDRSVEAGAEIADRIYGIGRQAFEGELTDFAEHCREEGLLLGDSDMPAALDNPAIFLPDLRWCPIPIRATFFMLATRRALRHAGFRATYSAMASRWPMAGAAPLTPAMLRAFGIAENLFIARRAPRDCLLRSLSLFAFLRSANIPVDHVIGVRRFPFRAHAWVEHRGERLIDRESGFTVIARIGHEAVSPA